MVRYLFDVEGVKFFLSEHISQNPLEKFFGCQRQCGRVNENPKISDFCKNTQALRVIGSFCRDTVKGNCRGTKRPIRGSERDEEPIPKRQKPNKKL